MLYTVFQVNETPFVEVDDDIELDGAIYFYYEGVGKIEFDGEDAPKRVTMLKLSYENAFAHVNESPKTRMCFGYISNADQFEHALKIIGACDRLKEVGFSNYSSPINKLICDWVQAKTIERDRNAINLNFTTNFDGNLCFLSIGTKREDSEIFCQIMDHDDICYGNLLKFLKEVANKYNFLRIQLEEHTLKRLFADMGWKHDACLYENLTNGVEVIGPALPQFISTPGPSARMSDVPVAPFARPSVSIGPALPPHLAEIGPSLPDDELRNSNHGVNSMNCPPPEPGQNKPDVDSRKTIGPALPPDLLPVNADIDDDEQSFGPLPPPPNGAIDPDMPFDVDDDDDQPIGPMPCTESVDQAATDYAIRRLELEQQQAASSSKTKREEWMTSLPTKLTNYGLGARTFSKSTSTAERDSSWTEGPNGSQRASTSTAATSQQSVADRLRDEEQEKIASQLNTNKEALMDSHNRKRKADAKPEEGSSSQRKPFDREKDMEVRGLKNATPAEIKERCGQLTSRFGSGNSQRFL